jgi:hypothetical protein
MTVVLVPHFMKSSEDGCIPWPRHEVVQPTITMEKGTIVERLGKREGDHVCLVTNP